MARRNRRSAFTVLEALISLALLAALLAAVAVAMHASLHSYDQNDRAATITQSARWVLWRMMADVRTADAVDSSSTMLRLIPPNDGSGLQLVQYEFANGILYVRRNVSGTTTSYPLLGNDDGVNVSDFTVVRQTFTVGGTTYTRSVTARLALIVDNQTLTVTASAVPRKNQVY